MTTESASAPKYGLGQNPRSLANLKPPWGKGENPNGMGARGPLITPHLKRLAQRGMTDLLELAADPRGLTGAETVALMLLMKAATDARGGDKAREQVLERLDGLNKLTFEVMVADEIKLGWVTDADTPAIDPAG